MSTCISKHGEFGSHETGDEFTCRLCGVFDEAGALRLLALVKEFCADWERSADEDERYLDRAHASEIHDVYASIRMNREHASALRAALTDTIPTTRPDQRDQTESEGR